MEDLKKTQSDVDAIDKERNAMMAKLDAKERRLRDKERALAERKIELAKKLRASKESELSEMQLQLMEKNAKARGRLICSNAQPSLNSSSLGCIV